MATLHRIGWLLFLLSAALFTVDGARNGNWLVVAASITFGGACVLFLLPRPPRSKQ